MKVGIDAKWYFDGPPSGHVVVKNIVDQLLLKNDSLDLYLFVDKNHIDKCVCFDKFNVTIVPIVAQPNLLSNLFIVPYWARKLKIDLLVFQNFPSLLPFRTKKISIVYDVLFLDYPVYYSRAELIYLNPIKFLSKQADQLITISQSEKERLIHHGIGKSENINVMYLGVDDDFKPLDQYPESKKIILRKNINFLRNTCYMLDESISGKIY
jgi:hypothetical protein